MIQALYVTEVVVLSLMINPNTDGRSNDQAGVVVDLEVTTPPPDKENHTMNVEPIADNNGISSNQTAFEAPTSPPTKGMISNPKDGGISTNQAIIVLDQESKENTNIIMKKKMPNNNIKSMETKADGDGRSLLIKPGTWLL